MPAKKKALEKSPQAKGGRQPTAGKPTSYTITQAAQKLGISRQAVHDAIKRGLLEAERGEIVQTVWLIPANSLKSYRVSDVHQSVGKKTS